MPKTKKEWDEKHPYNGKCYRCNHSWRRRTSKVPNVCPNPNCHSALYHKPRGKR